MIMKTDRNPTEESKSSISPQNLKFLLLGIVAGAVLMAVLMVVFESFATVLFGWQAIILSILILFTGILFRRAFWVLIGAILSIPFAFYLSATPLFRLVGLFLPLLLLSVAYAVQQERRWLAWLHLLLRFSVSGQWSAMREDSRQLELALRVLQLRKPQSFGASRPRGDPFHVTRWFPTRHSRSRSRKCHGSALGLCGNVYAYCAFFAAPVVVKRSGS